VSAAGAKSTRPDRDATSLRIHGDCFWGVGAIIARTLSFDGRELNH